MIGLSSWSPSLAQVTSTFDPASPPKGDWQSAGDWTTASYPDNGQPAAAIPWRCITGRPIAARSISKSLDDIDTVWATVVTGDSHTDYAGGVDLGIEGSPTYAIDADADIIIGAFNPSGFDLVGDIQQLMILESALGETDRLLLQDYFEGGMAPIIPQPPAVTPTDGGMFEISWGGRGVVLQRSVDLENWEDLPGAVSPLSVSPSPGGVSITG